MKKKPFCGMMMLSAVLLLAGCTADVLPSSVAVPGTDDQVPVNFSVSDQLSLTRAATNIVTFDANEQLKVYVKPAGADGYTAYAYTTAAAGQSNVSLTAPTPPPYFPAGAGTTVEAYAYYPASAVVGETFSVAANQTADADYKASDLMFAANRTITKGSAEGTNLAMSHLMAQLHLNITGQGVTVNRVLVNAKRNATFSVSAAGVPTVTTTGSASDIVAATAAGSAYVCIPQQQISTVTVKVETGSPDDDATTATFSFTSTSDFVAGSSYPINLTVSAAQLGTVTAITDWNGMQSVTYGPTGDFTIEPVSAVTYNGSAQTPSLTVKKDETTLTAGTDYDVEWHNNTNAGTAIAVVLGKGATYLGSVAVAKFTINKAAGSISYASATETKTYGNAAFTKTLTNTGDGTVTYQSGTTGVATVNATSGLVTIAGAGTTRITATVADGANYTYDTKTAYYDLTVNKASSSMSNGSGAVSFTASQGANSTASRTITCTNCSVSGVSVTSGSGFTATRSGNTITITRTSTAAFSGGVVTVTGTASNSNYNAPSNITIAVSATAYDPGVTLASATVGMLIASNGKAYTAANYSTTFGTAVAVVGYKNGSHGYAIALVNSVSQTWNQITNGGASKNTDCTLANDMRGSVPVAPTGTTWKILTKDNYSKLFQAMGSTVYHSPSYCPDSHVNGMITAYSSYGGTALLPSTSYYWTTSEYDDRCCWTFYTTGWDKYFTKNEQVNVRPVLVW